MALKQNISMANYRYDLPDERIAKHPVTPRHASKLLVYTHGQISDHQFTDISQFIPDDSLLVYNNTRVIHARLYFKKATGAKIEIFCLEPIAPNDHQLCFQQTEKVTWKCMVGNLKKWKGEPLQKEVTVKGNTFLLTASLLKRDMEDLQIEFSWNCGHSFSEIIEHSGIIPIPPYLNRNTEENDKLVYQTVYAKSEGSVAAPTAGLHFTDEVFSSLHKKNIARTEVTLHVGAGTFQPVKTNDVANHTMHAEWISVDQPTLKNLLTHIGKTTAVGTTTVRTLESLYWLGHKLAEQGNTNGKNLMVEQWAPYQSTRNMPAEESLQTLVNYLQTNKLTTLRFYTQIIIVPGYQFKLVNRIITNFHQPSSTLLLLVSAFIGEDWKRIYTHALDNNYRFLSFGDSSLLVP